ncbi:hypothetical protein BVC80_1593g20 [Macleaya cordata]|uniref:Uncharacterized protein n=1 Tax=Macleaya cordata TaxID=56857 RepID=A0A200QI75_MACCD|nr:hypothetical protein BVC80_1593g20 [Macleaya cordata]
MPFNMEPTKCHSTRSPPSAALKDETQMLFNMEPTKCEGWDWYQWEHLPQPLFRPLENSLV